MYNILYNIVDHTEGQKSQNSTASEVSCWRRPLRISQTVRNSEVYKRMNTQKLTCNLLKIRRKTWIGHLTRNRPCRITTII